MRSASPALQDFLRLRQPCWIAELYTIALADGSAFLNWTSFDQNVTYDGTTWVALGALVKRSRMSVRNTVEVPEMDISIAAADALSVDGVAIKTAVHNGIFDGARITVARVFMPTADASGNRMNPGDTSLGLITMFAGRLSQATITAPGVQFTAKGDNVLMNQQVPRNLYQSTCLHTFCDSGCTLLASDFTIANTVAFGATTTFIPWGSVPSTPLSPALFILGTITFTSGVCIGQVRTIRNADSSGVYLTYPLYGTPQQGDATSLLMGCAKSKTACANHTDSRGAPIDNSQHFRGYPFVPQVEYGV